MKTIYSLLLVLIPTVILTQNPEFKARYQEAPIIIKDGKKYSTLVKIKFTKGSINTKTTQKELKCDEVENEVIKNLFLSIKEKYGNFVIIKTFPNAFVNDTIRFSKRLNKYVSVPDLSQHFKLFFEKEIPLDIIIKELKEQKFIISADPPLESMACYDPNDPYYWNNSKWAFDKIEAQKAWNITKGDPSIKIAIHDEFNSGISTLHEDLIGNVISDNGKYCGHGITVAGIAAGKTDNSMGVASIGFNCKLILTQHYVNETLENIYNAANNADIINFSWITVTDATDLRDVIHYAINNGVLCVASAGNDKNHHGYDVPKKFEPASYSFSNGQVIAVTGTELVSGIELFRDGWNYSPGTDPINDPQNSFVDFSAPGGGYTILYQNTDPYIINGYLHENNFGSSLAAPFVSGTIGLILSVNYNLSPQQVFNILKSSSDKVGTHPYYPQSDSHTWNQYMGYGRINAYKALKYTLENYGGTLTQSLTIPSGETWNIQPGVMIKFASGASLIVNGTLNAVGNSSNRITFTRSGSSGTWGGIVVNSGAYAYIQYCDINYASTGVTVNNNSNRSQVTDCQINNNDYYGISIYNSQPTLQRNKIINAPSGGAFGIFCNYYGYPFVKDNLIKGYGTSGIYCVDHSGVYWLNSTANNVIKTNQNGLYLNNYSNAYLGNNQYNGQNSIYSNTGYDVKAIDNSIAYVQSTWWGLYPPNSSKFYNDGSSTIDRSNPLTYDPNNSLNLFAANDAGYNNSHSLTLNILSSENDEKKEIEEQLDLFKKNGSNKEGMEALQKIERLFTQYARKDFSEFSKKELRPLIKEKDRLYPLLLELEMHQLLINGEQKEALSINDELEKEVSDKTANKLALFRKGFIYLTEENDRTAAEKVFGEFITKYPEDELTAIVNYTLGKPNELNKAVTFFEEEKTAPEGFVLEDCYPNPFNPTTTIRYQIPQDGHVSLKVYDMLGREVAELVNEVKRAGEYTVSFSAVSGSASGGDGSKLSSGVYIYKLVGNNVNLSKKMILIK